MVSKTFVGKLFAQNAAFRGMEGNVLTGYGTEIPFLAGFKADLTSKM